MKRMKALLTVILFTWFYQNAWSSCIADDRSLTEMLFQGKPGVIFTCKILTFTTPVDPFIGDPNSIIHSDKNDRGTATAEIVTVYFGKVDTTVVTLRTSQNLIIDQTYLVFTNGSGRFFRFGGECDRRSKRVTDDTSNELQILKQFSDIFKC